MSTLLQSTCEPHKATSLCDWYLEGRATTFNKPRVSGSKKTPVIHRQYVFQSALQNDIDGIALCINHQPSPVLAVTRADARPGVGELQLWAKSDGLYFRAFLRTGRQSIEILQQHLNEKIWGVSIGYAPIQEHVFDGFRECTEISLIELSLTDHPADRDTFVKVVFPKHHERN